METDQAIVDRWLADLRSADAGRRLSAAQAIAEQKHSTPALVSALQQVARADHFSVRQAADRALAALSTGGVLVRLDAPLPAAQPPPAPAAQPAPAPVARVVTRPAPRAAPPPAPSFTPVIEIKGCSTVLLVAFVLFAANLALAAFLLFSMQSVGGLLPLAAIDVILAAVALERRRYDVAAGIVIATVAAGYGAWFMIHAVLYSLSHMLF